jgi:hypothetical protein
MTQFDFNIARAVGLAPSKQVEDSDQLLERAQALFDDHRATMDAPDCELAHSLLQ